MSANNYLLIRECGECVAYSVNEVAAETDHEAPLGMFNSLREACLFAQQYMMDEIVEYGIHFDFPKDVD